MKCMNGVLAGLFLLICTSGAFAQSDQEKMLQRYDKKMKKEFATKVAWEKTFEAAKERAKQEKKLMLAYFTRSYAP